MKNPINILMIAANLSNIQHVEAMLQEANFFKFEKADSLAMAKPLLESGSVDILLLDIDLRDSHDVQTFENIMAVARNTPMIILSKLFDEELAYFALNEGVQDYLIKGTFDERALTHSIIYAVERGKYRKSMKELEIIKKQSNIAIIILDLAGNILSWNEIAKNIYGYSNEEIKGKNFTLLFLPEDKSKGLDFLKMIKQPESNQFLATHIRKDEKKIQVLSTVTPIINKLEEITGYLLIAQDASYHKVIDIGLSIQYQVAKVLSESTNLSNAGIIILKICCEFFKWPAGEIWAWDPSENTLRLASFWGVNLNNLEKKRANILDKIYKSKVALCAEDVSGFPILFQNKILGVIVFWGDKSEFFTPDLLKLFHALSNQIAVFIKHKRMEGDLLYFSQHETLTGLPSRSLFESKLHQAIASAQWQHCSIALLYLDLDHFKKISDAFGHDKGELLIKEVSNRLRNSVRDSDSVSHLIGDEFAILLTNFSSKEDIVKIVNKIYADISASYQIDNNKMYVTASIGVSIYPGDGEEVKTLFKNAEKSMRQAKKNGRNQIFYFENFSEITQQVSMLKNQLYQALEKREFVLYYQPIAWVKSNRISGFEALLRWKRSDDKIILPGEFVPLIEHESVIVSVGSWIIRSVCLNIKKHPEIFKYPVSINIAVRQLYNNLLDNVSNILTETQVNPKNIIFELTENALIEQTENVIYTLNGLKKLGIAISLDDFGTSYSSLAYIQKFPIRNIKIDKTFIAGLPANKESAAIVTAIIALSHALNYTVIAEGVETPEQLAYLVEHQCDQYQGFLFSKPLPEEELFQFVKKCNY